MGAFGTGAFQKMRMSFNCIVAQWTLIADVVVVSVESFAQNIDVT